MDGNLNNGNGKNAQLEYFRKHAASLAENWQDNAKMDNGEKALIDFDDAVVELKRDDALSNDLNFTARTNTLISTLGKVTNEIKAISQAMQSPNPDLAAVDKALDNAAAGLQDFEKDYKNLRQLYAQETKDSDSFAQLDKLFAKKKFTYGKNILSQVDAFKKIPVVNANQNNIPPVVNNNQNIINDNQNIINVQPVIQPVIQPIQPQVQPVVQNNPNVILDKNGNPLDENNLYVRLLNHIDHLKQTLEDDVRNHKQGLTFDEIVQRQAEIDFLNKNIEKEEDRQKWIENKQNRKTFFENYVLENNTKGFQATSNRLVDIENNIKRVYRDFGIRHDRLIPDNLVKYYSKVAKNPLNAEKIREEKEALLQSDPTLFAQPVANEGIANPNPEGQAGEEEPNYEGVDLYQEKPADGFPEAKLKAIAKDLKFDLKTDYSPESRKLFEFFNPLTNPTDEKTAFHDALSKGLDRVHFVDMGRSVTKASTFRMYLMGRPENAYSFEEAFKIVPGHPKFEEEVQAYLRDLQNHPIDDEKVYQNVNGTNTLIRTNPTDPKVAEESAIYWGSIFSKCSDTISKFKLPDIDYTNPTEVTKHQALFHDLSLFAIDFGQNLDPFLGYNPPQYIEKIPGGRVGLRERTTAVNTLLSLTRNFKNAYNFNSFAPSLTAKGAEKDGKAVERFLRKVAVNRAAWGVQCNELIRGKTLGEIAKGTPQSLIETLLGDTVGLRLSQDRTIDKDIALSYLKNNDQRLVQKVLDSRVTEADNIRKMSFNGEQYTRIAEVNTSLKHSLEEGLRQKLRNLFTPGKTGRELYNQINTPDGIAATSAGSGVFRVLFETQNQPEMIRMGGINPLSMVRIDGKTIEETWGEKYAFLEDPLEKKKMYQAELANELVMGNSDITFDHYVITADYKIEKIGTIPVADSIKTVEKHRKFLKNVSNVNASIKDIRSSLDHFAMQPKPAAEGAFNQMKNAAKAVEDHSKISDNSNCNYQTLKSDLENYFNLAEQYYTLQEQAMRGANAPEADLRALAEEKKESFGKLREYLEQMEAYAATNRLAPNENEFSLDTDSRYTFGKIKYRLVGRAEKRLGYKLDIDSPIPVYDGDLQWLNELGGDGDHLPADRLAQVDAKFGLWTSKAYMEDRIASGMQMLGLKDENNNTVISSSDMTNDPARVHSLFTMWAMANKDYSISQAATLAEKPVVKDGIVVNQATINRNNELRREFALFVKAHPYLKKPQNETPEKETERIKAWADIYTKARAKLEAYTLPDIEYDDPKQILPYVNELTEMRGIAVDAYQEFDKLMNTTTFETAAKQFDSVKKFEDTRRFYTDFMTSVGTGLMSGHTVISENPSVGDISSAIERRYYSEQIMKPYKGKTVGEFMEGRADVLAYEETYKREAEDLVRQQLPNKLLFSYVLGANSEAFESEIGKAYKEAHSISRKSVNGQTLDQMRTARSKLVTPQMREALVASADDVDSMKALWNKPITDGEGRSTTIGEHINFSLHQAVGSFVLGSAHIKRGLTKSDLFVIDGQTAEEKWGAKYNNLSADEKEYMYRLEIAKAVAKGESTIEMRSFEINNKNEIVEGARKVVVVPKAQLQQMSDYAGAYLGERDNLLSELKDIRAQLITTHPSNKKDANFVSTDITGSIPYQNMCTALKNAIDILEKESAGEEIKPSEIRRKLEVLERASNIYYEGHKGHIFGPITDDGILRLGKSDKMKSGLVGRFDYMRAQLNSQMIVAGGETCKDADIKSLTSAIKSMRNGMGIIHEEDDYYKNSVIKRELNVKLRGLKGSMSVRNMESDSKELRTAKQYLLGLFEKYDAAPAKGVGAMKQNADTLRQIEHFDERAKELSKNPVFQKLMNTNPEDCINRWENIEKRQKELVSEYTREWNKFTDGYPDVAHYVFNIKNQDKENGITIQSKLRENAQDPDGGDLLTAFYDQAGKVMVIQLLAEADNERAKLYREEIAIDLNRFDQLVEKAAEYLRQRNVITVENASTFASKMNDEKYKSNFFTYLRNSEAAAEKQRAIEAKEIKDNKLSQLDFLLHDTDQPVSGENYDTANTLLHLTDLDPVMQKHVANAELMMRPMTGTKTDGKTETIQPVADVYAKCNFGTNRLASLHGPMMLYGMAEKNMSLDEVIRLVLVEEPAENAEQALKDEYKRAQQLRYDFYNFCKDHPVKDTNLSQEDLTKNFEAWGKLYKDGTEKFMQEKLPELNYRNEDEVNANLEKIGMIYRIIIDGDQELNKLFVTHTNGVDGLSTVKAACGGEKEYFELKNAWWNLSSKMSYFEHGYASFERLKKYEVTLPGQTAENLRSKILDLATMRCMAKQEMNSSLGKTFNEMAHSNPVLMLVQKSVVNTVKSVADEYHDDHGEYMDGLAPEDAINYLLGIATEPFEKGIQRLVEQQTAIAKQDRNNKMISNAALNGRGFKLDDPGVTKLLQTQDDAASMQDFLTQKIKPQEENSPTGEAWLSEKLDQTWTGLFNQETGEICQVLNINPSELIRVGGKSPEELWGEKYANVDPKLKERLYRLEIAKEFAKGENEISMRTFTLGSERLIEDPKPVLISPKREDIKRLIDGVHVYEAGRLQMQLELNRIQQEMAQTQVNPLANFMGNTTEGSAEYRDIIRGFKELKKCVDEDHDLDTKVTVQNYLDCFDYVQRAAREFERKNAGSKDARIKQRVEISRKLQEVMPRMKESYLHLRKGFESDLPAISNVSFKDAPYYIVKDAAKDLEQNRQIQPEVEKTYLDRYIRDEINVRLDVIKNSPLPEDSVQRENARMVRDYLDHIYRTKAEDGLYTEEELHKFDADYKAHAAELIDNSTFQNLMRRYGAKTMGLFWGDAEEISKAIKQSAQDTLDRYQDTYHYSLARYFSNDPTPHNNRSREELNRSAAEYLKENGRNYHSYNDEEDDFREENSQVIEKAYERLANLLVLQMMCKDTPVGKSLRSLEAVEGTGKTAEREREIIVYNITQILKKNDVLKPGNVDKCIRHLESGRLAEDMEKTYESSRMWNEEQARLNRIQKEAEAENDLGKSYDNFIRIRTNEDRKSFQVNNGLLYTADNNVDDNNNIIDNYIHDDINEDDIDNELGKKNEGLFNDDDSMDDEQDDIKLNNIRNELGQNKKPGGDNTDYDKLYEKCLDKEKFARYNDPNNIMNDPDGGELHGITKDQFTHYMKGTSMALAQLNDIEREEKYEDGENAEELAAEKGKLFIHAVTARALYTGTIKIRPKENIAQLEERVFLGYAANSKKPEDKTIRTETLKYVLQNTKGADLATYARDGEFDQLMATNERIVRENMKKGQNGPHKDGNLEHPAGGIGMGPK